jgi:probable rRNA maturation factor
VALSISILNRQRRISVDMAQLESMTEVLSKSVLKNLAQQKLKRLPMRDLDDMSRRGSLSLVLVSDRKIRELNRQWRGKDYATDVLSFPLAVDERGVFERAEQSEETWEIGELIISMEKAAEQAAQYGHSNERELAFLFVHGFLHILGFDHITKAQEKEMFARQSEILVAAGFPR